MTDLNLPPLLRAALELRKENDLSPLFLPPSEEMNPETQHLGDGVYVSNDGYSIAIAVNDPRKDPVVILEPSVMKALVEYAKQQGFVP